MLRGTGRRLALIGAVAAAVALAAGEAGSHSFGKWSGQTGPFAWESKRLSCGDAGGEPNRIRAHTRWRTSPQNGYARLRFTRQVKKAGEWVTVQRQSRSTKNTDLEGTRFVLHWSQRFRPFGDEGGLRSRDVIDFTFARDRPGRDRVLLERTRTERACTVGA